MSVIRLELTIPDPVNLREISDRLLGEWTLIDPEHAREPWTASSVRVMTDAAARRERIILEAASYFFRDGPEMTVPGGKAGA